MSQPSRKEEQFQLLHEINRVEGFDPAAFAVEYTDMNTGEVRKRLPVMIQMAWFRLKYPEGRIAVEVTPAKDCFVAKARVYPSYRDGPECYLAEATASRGPDPAHPSVSPREWAQTAAVGVALRNAGFSKNLGVPYNVVLFLGLSIAAMITASVVVVVGSISYIGLIVPNIVAMFKGDKIRGTLVDTALFGAIFVLVCDMVARVVIAPYELPIELIVGIIGSVLFIGLLLYRLKHGRKAIRLGAAHSGACASAVSQEEGGRGQ